ncbi:MAG TPA: sigma-70 family RNA polymerase sigma factor [Thermoanaerobaculia bacterium]|jgi:RNA polymerase sigma-70 factor (ECF subfamily)|nr:sigma-70 family RNA polymerase sigma factor [Thermoanaerobaculia bacterium]
MSAADPSEAESSLEQFLKSVRPRMKTLFAHYRVPPQDTEDIVQQALLALVYQRQAIRDPESWLMGTLRNKCLLYWRERRRKLYDAVDAAVLECMAEPMAPEQEGADVRRDLAMAIDRLPGRCRALLSLRYSHGYEPPELARRLGYSPTSISKTTNRCLAALTRELTAGLSRKKTP